MKILSFGFASAITIWPIILLQNKDSAKDKILLQHERIHLQQQLELLLLGFFILYFMEYIFYRLHGLSHMNAYRSISFEQEAFSNEFNHEYLLKRKRYSFYQYLFK